MCRAQNNNRQQQPADFGTAAAKLNLYRHVTTDNASEYIQLMRLFTGTLLTDLSAAEAHEALLSVLGELAAAGALTNADTGWPSPADAWCGLAELASRCTGDAHGLDTGRVASALILRAAAAAFGIRVPESASDVRDLWSRRGVLPDEVSGTVMAWGLQPPGNDAWSVMMRSRANLELVTQLTLQELTGAATSATWAEPGVMVSVCENPQVLQAAARAEAALPLVCISGNLSNAGWMLLHGLVAQDVRVRYHGDFDWAGAAISGRVLSAGVEPWRLGAEDYAAAVAAAGATSKLALSGNPGETPWDPRLAAQMSRLGIAVHEESLLGDLLRDMA